MVIKMVNLKYSEKNLCYFAQASRLHSSGKEPGPLEVRSRRVAA